MRPDLQDGGEFSRFGETSFTTDNAILTSRLAVLYCGPFHEAVGELRFSYHVDIALGIDGESNEVV